MNGQRTGNRRSAGFTLIELLIGTVILMIVVTGALSVYVKSNKTSVDQQQYVHLQSDVRAALYFISRDVRMAGMGLTGNSLTAFIQGVDAESQGGTVQPDRLKLMGNVGDPLVLTIQTSTSGRTSVTLPNSSFEQYPYANSYYVGKIVLLLPSTSSSCRGAALRQITAVQHTTGGTGEGFTLSSSPTSGITLPGSLQDTCADSEYAGGSILLVNVREYWLDVTGNYSGLTAGQNGYIGGGVSGVLYMTDNGVHYPLAQNIENLQFQYNGNFDNDSAGTLDGFTDWQSGWTLTQIGSIRQVRIWVLGRTPDRMVSVSMTTADPGSLYRRPAVANSAAASADDWHKRFLLETTAMVRNLSLNLYNTGLR